MINLLFFFSTTKIGGAETNIVKITNGLSDIGYRVFWAAIEDNGPLLSLPNSSESFTEIGDPMKNPISAYKKYKKLIRENEIQIVSAFGLRVELFVRLLSKRINSNIKVVSNIRSSDSWRKWFHSRLDRFTAKSVDIWVSNSFAAVQVFALREKLDVKKTVVIYNFVEFENIIRTFDDLQSIKIGVLANYCKAKGHFNLIKLSEELVKRNMSFEFICAGHDYTDGELNDEIEKANLTNNIRLVGHVTDKTEFFNQIDVFFYLPI
jgi:glycosyltransferase involved in cell wall biosynthesis